MKRTYSTLLKIAGAFGVIISPFIILFIVFMAWKIPIHNFNLWRLGGSFQTIAPLHPRHSKPLLEIKDFGGLFAGASNSCDYLVGEFRSAAYPKERIAQAYRGLLVPSFNHTELIPVEVHFADDEEFFESYPWHEWREKLYGSLGSAAIPGTVYAVFVSQTGYPPDGDFRCH